MYISIILTLNLILLLAIFNYLAKIFKYINYIENRQIQENSLTYNINQNIIDIKLILMQIMKNAKNIEY